MNIKVSTFTVSEKSIKYFIQLYKLFKHIWQKMVMYPSKYHFLRAIVLFAYEF